MKKVADSMFFDYIKEREGFDHVATDRGFATYRINYDTNEVYIKELYVKPECRHSDEAQVLANAVCNIAKEKGCNVLLGTTDITANDVVGSMGALMFYKMRPFKLEGNTIFWYKEI